MGRRFAAKKPKRFEYNLVVIGAGSAGLVAAYIAAAMRAKVALVEAQRMGGDCLYTGCVPSKALLRTAKLCAAIRRGEEFGLRPGAPPEVDFAAVMERVQAIVRRIEPHDSVERYTRLGVECVRARAQVLSPWHVQAGDRTLVTRNIVVASGARPIVPPLPGLDRVPVLTSDNLWDLRELPGRLLVLGGGPIGCELGQAFARLGSRVTLVQRGPRLLPREDPELSTLIRERLESEGVRVLTGHAAQRLELDNGRPSLVCRHGERERRLELDRILVAVGRRPNVQGFGLEALGVEVAPTGSLSCDRFLQTSVPGIYCAGDVVGPYRFTHAAAHQAWYASINALFGGLKRFAVDYRAMPWATFTDPEVARVGLSETEAREQGIPYEVTRCGLGDLDRAIADSEAVGEVKVLTKPGRDRILGATVVAPHAGDLIAELVLAMRHGIGLNGILAAVHIYPTLAEVNKRVAGQWRRRHVPDAALRWLQRLHRWRRWAWVKPGGERGS
jgi:pyruvate/2-oxoglutarate dehydrogenase complex dihydrolipoamide dehydrogenase (E3) component